MTVVTWEVYRSYITDKKLSETFDLNEHPEGKKRSTFNSRVCYCNECRKVIDEEYQWLWSTGQID